MICMEGYNNLSEIESNLEYLAEWELDRAVDGDGWFARYYAFGDWAHPEGCDPDIDGVEPEKIIYMDGPVGDEGTCITVTQRQRDINGGTIADTQECRSRAEALMVADQFARQLSD